MKIKMPSRVVTADFVQRCVTSATISSSMRYSEWRIVRRLLDNRRNTTNWKGTYELRWQRYLHLLLEASSSGGYQRLRNDDFIPEQFKKPKHQQPIPYQSIGSAVALFLLGALLITLAILINLSMMPEAFYESMWGFYLLGSLLFIPGAHYTYIAYQAYYETPGYTYDDIPIMN